MQDNFVKSLARVLVYEGGFSNDPDDPGGATMKGVTQGTYNSWRSRHKLALASVSKITDAELQAIYKNDYWDRINGDDLPTGVDFCIFDAAVNSGVGGATKWAQSVVDLSPDGDIGPKTMAAIIAADPEDFIHEFCAHRLGTLQRLKTWGKFGKGWSARISNVQKTALGMAQSATDDPNIPQVHTEGGNAKARPQDVPVSKVSQITAHATTVGGVVAAGAAQAGQTMAGVDLPWVKYVLGGVALVGAVAGVIVYISKQANDAATNASRKAVVDSEADTGVPTILVPAGGANG